MVLKQPLILKPSYWLAGFLIVIHMGAMLALSSVVSNIWTILIVSIFVLLSLIKNIRRYALRQNANAIVEIRLKNKDEWLLQTKQGNTMNAKLAKSSFRSRYLVVLNFYLPENNQKLTIIILPDSLETKAFKRLRSVLLFV